MIALKVRQPPPIVSTLVSCMQYATSQNTHIEKNAKNGNLHRHYRLSTAWTSTVFQQHFWVSIKNKRSEGLLGGHLRGGHIEIEFVVVHT